MYLLDEGVRDDKIAFRGGSQGDLVIEGIITTQNLLVRATEDVYFNHRKII
jgi:hypothetical protein